MDDRLQRCEGKSIRLFNVGRYTCTTYPWNYTEHGRNENEKGHCLAKGIFYDEGGKYFSMCIHTNNIPTNMQYRGDEPSIEDMLF